MKDKVVSLKVLEDVIKQINDVKEYSEIKSNILGKMIIYVFCKILSNESEANLFFENSMKEMKILEYSHEDIIKALVDINSMVDNMNKWEMQKQTLIN